METRKKAVFRVNTVLGEEKSKPDENTAAISSVVVFVVVVVVVFELYRYFAPTT